MRKVFRKRSVGSQYRKTFMCFGIVLIIMTLSGIISLCSLCAVKSILGENSYKPGITAVDHMGTAVETLIQERLLATAAQKAAYIEEKVLEAESYVRGIAACAEDIYEYPERYPDRNIMMQVKDNNEFEAQLLWAKMIADAGEERLGEIKKLANLQDMLMQYAANNEMVYSAFVAAESGWLLEQTNHLPGVLSAAGDKYGSRNVSFAVDYKERAASWYREAAQAQAGECVYSYGSEEVQGAEGRIICAQPIYADGRLMAVAGVSFSPDIIEQVVLGATMSGRGYSFLLNEKGEVEVSPMTKGETAVDPDGKRNLRNSENVDIAKLAQEMAGGGNGLAKLTVNGEEAYLAYVPIKPLNWSFVAVMPTGEVEIPVQESYEKVFEGTEEIFAEWRTVIVKTLLVFIIFAVLSMLFCLCLNGLKKEESITGRADWQRIPEVASFVEHCLRAGRTPAKAQSEILAAVDELFSNICKYSMADTAKVSCRIGKRSVRIMFEDDGIPFNPLKQQKPDVTLPVNERTPGGLGIYMVRSTMDQVTYRYAGGKNRLAIKKKI